MFRISILVNAEGSFFLSGKGGLKKLRCSKGITLLVVGGDKLVKPTDVSARRRNALLILMSGGVKSAHLDYMHCALASGQIG